MWQQILQGSTLRAEVGSVGWRSACSCTVRPFQETEERNNAYLIFYRNYINQFLIVSKMQMYIYIFMECRVFIYFYNKDLMFLKWLHFYIHGCKFYFLAGINFLFSKYFVFLKNIKVH